MMKINSELPFLNSFLFADNIKIFPLKKEIGTNEKVKKNFKSRFPKIADFLIFLSELVGSWCVRRVCVCSSCAFTSSSCLAAIRDFPRSRIPAVRWQQVGWAFHIPLRKVATANKRVAHST
jgi:hypothetical protein